MEVSEQEVFSVLLDKAEKTAKEKEKETNGTDDSDRTTEDDDNRGASV
mgnify:CR=1 FL=1